MAEQQHVGPESGRPSQNIPDPPAPSRANDASGMTTTPSSSAAQPRRLPNPPQVASMAQRSSSYCGPPGCSPPSSLYTAIISPKEMAAHEASNFKDVKGVYKNCRGIWAAQWTDERGQRHTKYFNPKYYATEAEARREAFKFKVHIAREIELRGGVQKRRSCASTTTSLNSSQPAGMRPSDASSVFSHASYVRDRSSRRGSRGPAASAGKTTTTGSIIKPEGLRLMVDRELEMVCLESGFAYASAAAAANVLSSPAPGGSVFDSTRTSGAAMLYQDYLLLQHQAAAANSSGQGGGLGPPPDSRHAASSVIPPTGARPFGCFSTLPPSIDYALYGTPSIDALDHTTRVSEQQNGSTSSPAHFMHMPSRVNNKQPVAHEEAFISPSTISVGGRGASLISPHPDDRNALESLCLGTATATTTTATPTAFQNNQNLCTDLRNAGSMDSGLPENHHLHNPNHHQAQQHHTHHHEGSPQHVEGTNSSAFSFSLCHPTAPSAHCGDESLKVGHGGNGTPQHFHSPNNTGRIPSPDTMSTGLAFRPTHINSNDRLCTLSTVVPRGSSLCACGCGGLALAPSRYAAHHHASAARAVDKCVPLHRPQEGQERHMAYMEERHHNSSCGPAPAHYLPEGSSMDNNSGYHVSEPDPRGGLAPPRSALMQTTRNNKLLEESGSGEDLFMSPASEKTAINHKPSPEGLSNSSANTGSTHTTHGGFRIPASAGSRGEPGPWTDSESKQKTPVLSSLFSSSQCSLTGNMQRPKHEPCSDSLQYRSSSISGVFQQDDIISPNDSTGSKRQPPECFNPDSKPSSTSCELTLHGMTEGPNYAETHLNSPEGDKYGVNTTFEAQEKILRDTSEAYDRLKLYSQEYPDDARRASSASPDVTEKAVASEDISTTGLSVAAAPSAANAEVLQNPFAVLIRSPESTSHGLSLSGKSSEKPSTAGTHGGNSSVLSNKNKKTRIDSPRVGVGSMLMPPEYSSSTAHRQNSVSVTEQHTLLKRTTSASSGMPDISPPNQNGDTAEQHQPSKSGRLTMTPDNVFPIPSKGAIVLRDEGTSGTNSFPEAPADHDAASQTMRLPNGKVASALACGSCSSLTSTAIPGSSPSLLPSPSVLSPAGFLVPRGLGGSHYLETGDVKNVSNNNSNSSECTGSTHEDDSRQSALAGSTRHSKSSGLLSFLSSASADSSSSPTTSPSLSHLFASSTPSCGSLAAAAAEADGNWHTFPFALSWKKCCSSSLYASYPSRVTSHYPGWSRPGRDSVHEQQSRYGQHSEGCSSLNASTGSMGLLRKHPIDSKSSTSAPFASSGGAMGDEDMECSNCIEFPCWVHAPCEGRRATSSSSAAADLDAADIFGIPSPSVIPAAPQHCASSYSVAID